MSELKSYAVWDVPTRLFHWINAICVIALVAVGYLVYVLLSGPTLSRPSGDPAAELPAGHSLLRIVHFSKAHYHHAAQFTN